MARLAERLWVDNLVDAPTRPALEVLVTLNAKELCLCCNELEAALAVESLVGVGDAQRMLRRGSGRLAPINLALGPSAQETVSVDQFPLVLEADLGAKVGLAQRDRVVNETPGVTLASNDDTGDQVTANRTEPILGQCTHTTSAPLIAVVVRATHQERSLILAAIDTARSEFAHELLAVLVEAPSLDSLAAT